MRSSRKSITVGEGSTPLSQVLIDELLRRGENVDLYVQQCIWPSPYNEFTDKAALAFVMECCWTWNEADQVIGRIPDKEYIRDIVDLWFWAFSNRVDYILEKSRRMVASWVYRCLELWVCGLRRSNWLLCDQDYEQSAKHVWRYHFLLEAMRVRRSDMRVDLHQHRGELVKKQLDMVILPNGSTLSNANQQAGALQGDGKTGITLEEFSRYRYPAALWSQAKFLTMGSPTSRGGWVCAINNASPNEEYRELKGFISRVDAERCAIRQSALLS